MNKTFIINRGAGKVITAIPALEKYHKLNSNNDYRIIPKYMKEKPIEEVVV